MRLMLLEKTHRYSGSLASLTFYDLSPVGYKYRQRFVTMDKQVLNFELFRYTKPDMECERDWDIRFKLRMSQIRYIHTHRFQSELIAYFLHFHQLLELVNHYRAAMVGAEVTELGRGSRVKLDITARGRNFSKGFRLKKLDILIASKQNSFGAFFLKTVK